MHSLFTTYTHVIVPAEWDGGGGGSLLIHPSMCALLAARVANGPVMSIESLLRTSSTATDAAGTTTITNSVSEVTFSLISAMLRERPEGETKKGRGPHIMEYTRDVKCGWKLVGILVLVTCRKSAMAAWPFFPVVGV